MLHCSTSWLHATSTMLCKATSSPSPKKHNFLPFKDKLELIRKCEASLVVTRHTARLMLEYNNTLPQFHHTVTPGKCYPTFAFTDSSS
ncbi:hypothetical protein E2C01_073257 [Portunus trituberculatus]|uniref:Uncharacterized protein n=1 Tax=Portunus trituberculatus TaxID=210409 RepID=A0A5B7IA35_PORTR|nr:hypothetical protein [Portunus trituberculatus]